MKVVLLAGGFGTRLSERTGLIPKPMVEIGGRPMLWHIMKLYSYHGFDDFIIALGYKGDAIKDYFLNYKARQSDCTVNLSTGHVDYHNDDLEESWKVTLVDTGENTMTGGRIRRLREHLDDTFMLTYGDGISDIHIGELVEFHNNSNTKATVTAVHPKAHYGELDLEGNNVMRFMEKPDFRMSWINGGFMVLEPSVFDLIEGDEAMFEREPLEQLSVNRQLSAYCHEGFWQCMDTLRDVNYLNDLWDSGDPPWRIW